MHMTSREIARKKSQDNRKVREKETKLKSAGPRVCHL